MDFLLSLQQSVPAHYIYLGIGSCPHHFEGGQLISKHDQLLPPYIKQLIDQKKGLYRIVHFDPCFADRLDLLRSYFDSQDMVFLEQSSGYSWIHPSGAVEVFVFPERLDHNTDKQFFEMLRDSCLNDRTRLIIQEFTGYATDQLEKSLLESCSQPELFKRRILIDPTFGTDEGCCTDMNACQLYLDSAGNFINPKYMTEMQKRFFIGKFDGLDAILKRQCRMKFKEALNTLHVEYRRSLRGEPGFQSALVRNPGVIMQELQGELEQCARLLQQLQIFTPEQAARLSDLFKEHKDYDPYKWYDAVNGLV